MRSLTFKLTLAFLLVGITGSLLVALIVQQRTRLAFGQFLFDREQQTLVETLTSYYLVNGAWQGAADVWETQWNNQPPPIQNGPEMRRDWRRFTLVDLNGVVIVSDDPGRTGTQLSQNELEGAIPLEVNGSTAGWLVMPKGSRDWNPNTPEGLFLDNVRSAALLSALVASILALTLGGLLAFNLTRSLRELTEATVEIARGKLGRLVKVRSRDEVGVLAASLNKMSGDLERATQARRQMTADIAHDLRSPLSVIAGYTEALSDGKLPGTPETYTTLYKETQYLSRLVEDLRLLSLADAGELPLTMQPVAPQTILEQVTARHVLAAQQLGIVLRCELAQNLPLVKMDFERMTQVLDNLVLNAFRYTIEGGEVILSAQVGQPAGVQFIVRDNGTGIAPEDLPHIFDRFYRGDKSRSHTGESGLGLAIARSLVEAQGGTIVAESTPGIGTLITILLPES